MSTNEQREHPRSRVTIVDYDPSWPAVFESIRSAVWDVVSDVALSIEHVGSTAIPGMPAKPVIDVDVVVPEGGTAAVVERLARLGYRHRGDLGIPDREAFHPPQGSPAHHLYVCSAGSAALANHVTVRDHLRTNPASARAYATLKRELAREHGLDRGGYNRAKTDFLLRILREAGLDEDRLAEVERANGPLGWESNASGASVDSYWAGRLGIAVPQLREPGVRVVSNVESGFEDYAGVFFFSRNDTLIVCAPPALLESCARSATALSAASIGDVQLLRKTVGPRAGVVVGPAFQGVVEPDSLTPCVPERAVALADVSSSELGRLKEACDEEEWVASGMWDVASPIAVAVAGDEVMGAAGLRRLAPGVAGVCVLTHPGHRGSGLGTELVSHLVSAGASAETLVLYQTLFANRPAIRIAERLGIRLFATTLAIRLEPATDRPEQAPR